MAESSRIFSIERLNNENYGTWSFEVEMLLRREDLWKYVETKTAAADENWKTADGKALASIVLACERTQYSLVQQCKTSREAWLSLKKRHEELSNPASASAVKKWCTMSLEPDGDMEKFLNEWESACTKLERNDFSFVSKFKVYLLLGSLPAEYHPLVVALESRDDLDMTYVKGRLIDEYKRNVEMKQPSDHLLMSRHQYREPKHQGRELKYQAKGTGNHGLSQIYRDNYVGHQERSRCWRCGDSGHMRHQCPRTDRDLRQTQERAVLARASEDLDPKDKPILFMFKEENNVQSGWYLDSGATTHVCRNVNSFRKFRGRGGTTDVKLANGTSVTAAGRGDVEIKILDEAGRARDFTANDVLYVPDALVNVLSVKQITKRGLDVLFQGSKAYIRRNAQTVAVAELEDGLYRIKEAAPVTSGRG